MIETKTVVTVAEMARMCGRSRARFYQLQKAGAVPLPLYHVATKRPIYTEEQQVVCLEVRRRNCGVDGRPILFYARRATAPISTKKNAVPRKNTEIISLMQGLASLGLSSVTAVQVEKMVAEIYPSGISGLDEGEVMRAVFLRIRRQNAADNVGR